MKLRIPNPSRRAAPSSVRPDAHAEVRAYHEEQLLDLLERVREGFAVFDSGGIDAFGLDDHIRRYRLAARKLDEFCGSTGPDLERAARDLAWLDERGEQPDWWTAGAVTGDAVRVD